MLELEDINSETLIGAIDYVMSNLKKISKHLINGRDKLQARQLKNIRMLNKLHE